MDLKFVITAANEVCEGFVFTDVCMSTGGEACMRGACMVEGGCMEGDVCGKGACMVGGHVWQGGDLPGRYHEIRSMNGRYASYWIAFLFFYCPYYNKAWLVLKKFWS